MKRSNESSEIHSSSTALPGKKKSRFDNYETTTQISELAPVLGSVAAERAALTAIAISKQKEIALANAARIAAALAGATSTSSSIGTSVSSSVGLVETTIRPTPQLQRASNSLPPPLLLDPQGRPIDQQGNLIQEERRAGTSSVVTKGVSNSSSSTSTSSSSLSSSATATVTSVVVTKPEKSNPYLSQRTATGQQSGTLNKRIERSIRGLQFREAGTIAQSAEELRQSAIRAAQYMATREAGGRSRPILHNDHDGDENENDQLGHTTNRPPVAQDAADAASAASAVSGKSQQAQIVTDISMTTSDVSGTNSSTSIKTEIIHASSHIVSSTKMIPLKPKGTSIPHIEWWDAVYLSPARISLYNSHYTAPGRKAATAAAAIAATAAGTSSLSSSTSASEQSSTALVNQPSFSYSELSITNQRSHSFVQHPVPVLPHISTPIEPNKPPVLMLTKEERKKLRRQVREERNKLLQDQIRMGLIKPPPPKIKISNMMRVLKDAAVADPSLIEARIKAETARNIQKSKERNEALKLTPEEREERNKKKLCAHEASGPECAVYRLGDSWIRDKQARYKIDINSKQLYLSGTAISVRHTDSLLGGKGLCVLIIEGGKKAVNKMNSLLMRRINWHRLAQEAAENAKDEMDTDDEDSEDEENEDDVNDPRNIKSHGAGPGGECELVWRGTVPKRFFVQSGSDFGSGLRFEECKTTIVARKVLENKGLSHFYDVVAANARLAAASASEGGGKGGDSGDMDAAWLLGGAEEALSTVTAKLEKEGFVQKKGREEEGDEDMSD